MVVKNKRYAQARVILPVPTVCPQPRSKAMKPGLHYIDASLLLAVVRASALPIGSASTRAAMSVEPPGGKGTISLIGLP